MKLNNESTYYLNTKLSLTKCMVDICKNAEKDEDFRSLGDKETFATSVAHKEPRVFEFSASPEKRNLFEGSGAISEWELKITGLDKKDGMYPIENVIIYLSYTAKN